MAETTKTTQETSRASGIYSAAAQKAPLQSGTEQMGEQMGEIVDQAKQTVNDVYQKASKSVNETLGQAKEYSRENPGTATLAAFGIGVGVGVLLASGVLTSGRSRSQRIVPPIMTAISEIAGELFRR